MPNTRKISVAVLYPTDPAGDVIGGIETFIRGLIKYSPEDIEYLVIGATTDDSRRPLHRWTDCRVGNKIFKYFPIMRMNEANRQPRIPATIRYEVAAMKNMPPLDGVTILESHRIEHFILRGKNESSINLFFHQNMRVILEKKTDIRWKFIPRLYYYLEKKVLEKTSSAFFVREDAVESYKRAFPVLEGCFHFIPTWMDPEIFYPASRAEIDGIRAEVFSKYEIAREDRLLVSVGRLDHQKDPGLLIEALSLVYKDDKNICLLWIGDGVLRKVAKKKAKECGLSEKVKFAGFLRSEKIADILRVADMFVLSSVYEGMPIALIEAMGCGLPAVSTDVGEVRRLVIVGKNGEISKERTPIELAKSITDCMERLDKYKGLPCLETARQYTPERVLGKVYQNYRQLAKKK